MAPNTIREGNTYHGHTSLQVFRLPTVPDPTIHLSSIRATVPSTLPLAIFRILGTVPNALPLGGLGRWQVKWHRIKAYAM